MRDTNSQKRGSDRRQFHLPSQSTGTGRDRWIDRDLQVLSACRNAMSLAGIAEQTAIPRSAVHRRVQKLCDLGLLEREGNAYRVSDAGERFLEVRSALRPKGLSGCFALPARIRKVGV